MSDYKSQLSKTNKIPNWTWLSLVPIVGSFGIIYAGNKINKPRWIKLGIVLLILGLFFSSTEFFALIWLLQVGNAFALRKEFILKNNSSHKTESNYSYNRKMLPKPQEKVDINVCSQNDLVYKLNLPIVYANEIVSLRNEGHIFTHIEELAEIVEIPENTLKRIEPFIDFNYYPSKESNSSWRKCNTLSLKELLDCNLDSEVANKIIAERENNGLYKSFTDLRKRTGFSIHRYKSLL